MSLVTWFSLLGDDLGYRVVGIGDIKFKMHDVVERVLQGVMHVPGLRRNLISHGLLQNVGMYFRSEVEKAIGH